MRQTAQLFKIFSLRKSLESYSIWQFWLNKSII